MKKMIFFMLLLLDFVIIVQLSTGTGYTYYLLLLIHFFPFLAHTFHVICLRS